MEARIKLPPDGVIEALVKKAVESAMANLSKITARADAVEDTFRSALLNIPVPAKDVVRGVHADTTITRMTGEVEHFRDALLVDMAAGQIVLPVKVKPLQVGDQIELVVSVPDGTRKEEWTWCLVRRTSTAGKS